MAGRSNPPPLNINPPLLNSANPWATTADDLAALYKCSSTGAVTTRTTLIDGFNHDPAKHQYVFFDAVSHGTSSPELPGNSSVNSLGYSPLNLEAYLAIIQAISKSVFGNPSKGFIVSVTGSPEDVAQCYRHISHLQSSIAIPLAMEINLSCPNIPNAPPPAYSGESLLKYLAATVEAAAGAGLARIPFGIKTPPYTHSTEFQTLVDALLASAASSGAICPVSFITATNTLGSCLLLPRAASAEATTTTAPTPALPGCALGGMAGAALHPLALGNVATLRRLTSSHEPLKHIQIIGVGGVLDGHGYARMRAVGADAVAVGTGLGLKGVDIFSQIEKDLEGKW